MSNIPVSLACWDYDRTRPLIDGRVKAAGLDLDIKLMRPREAFVRMLEHKEFDASEISLSSYVTLKAKGDCPFVAIPVMLSKMFRHSCIYVRSDSGIRRPADLKGKRVGATQFASTGLVFIKGMLQHEHGVVASDLLWVIGGLDHVAPKPLRLPDMPAGVTLRYESERSLEDLFEAGDLDALFALYIPKLFEKHSDRIVRLFPDFKAVEQDYFRRTGIYPIMHTVAIRQDVHEKNPQFAPALYRAFCEARDLALDGLYDTDALRVGLPWLIDHIEETRAVMGPDYFSYDLDANRPALDAIGQYLFEQKLAPRVVTPDELFLSFD